MRPDSPNDSSIIRDASQWLARSDRGLTPTEQQALTQWLDADKRHADAYSQMRSTWGALDMAGELADQAEMARELDEQTRIRPRTRLLMWRPTLALAAAVAFAALVGAWRWHAPVPVVDAASTANYRVIPNSVQRLVLADGSVAELRGDDSVIETSFTAAERRVRLIRGEAHFEVVKDPARPFAVVAGPIAIRAVGTAFNVQMDAANLTVVVTEGRVSLAQETQPSAGATPREPAPLAPPLEAGQRAQLAREVASNVPRPVKVDSLSAAELDAVLSWQATWLVFDATPLEDTIKAFNRYGSHRLVLGDASLRGRQLAGKFRADNVEGFLRLLELTMNVKVVRREGREIVLESQN